MMKWLAVAVLFAVAGCGSGSLPPSQPDNPGYHVGRWTSDTGSGEADLIIPDCEELPECKTVGWLKPAPGYLFTANRDNLIIESSVPNLPVGSTLHYQYNPSGFLVSLRRSGVTYYTLAFSE